MDKKENIPKVPCDVKDSMHKEPHEKYKEPEGTYHFHANIDPKFHEGHEKHIPDPKDAMDHCKFEKCKELVKEHLFGYCGKHAHVQ